MREGQRKPGIRQALMEEIQRMGALLGDKEARDGQFFRSPKAEN